MKKVLVLLMAAILLSACGSERAVNDNVDDQLAKESYEVVEHIRESIEDNKDADRDMMFAYTDEYYMEDEDFDSLNGYEQGVVAQVSDIIIRYTQERYTYKVKFERDADKFYDILENGDDVFITN